MKINLTSLLLLIFAFLVTHASAETNENWAVGRWFLTNITNTAPTTQDAPIEMEKQMMIFQEDGSIRRYSKEKGFTDLLFTYKTADNEIYLQALKNKYLPAGHLREDGSLVLDFTKGRILVYKHISPLASFDKIDFDGMIQIQFKQTDQANQSIHSITASGGSE
jgi:hypothetical protein